MHLAYTPEQEALRTELRAYFAELMTPEVTAASFAGETGDPACLEAVRQMNTEMGRGQNCLFVSDHPPSKYVLDILYRCFESVHRLGEDERAIQNFVAGYGEIFYCKGLREFPLATMREALPR